MLPFHITRLFGLTSKTHGFALANDEGIRLVFRDVDDIKSAPDDEAESVLIEWNNLVELVVKRGVFGDRLTIEVREIPGRSPDDGADNRIELKSQRRDRRRLEQFQRDVEDYRAGRRKDDVDEVLDDVRDLLDRM